MKRISSPAKTALIERFLGTGCFSSSLRPALLSTSTPEPAQAIDKINISAFVSDFSDASVENTSEVWTESLDVGPKDSVPVPVDEGVDVTFLSDSLVDVEDVGAKDSDEALQPFAGSRGLVSLVQRGVILAPNLNTNGFNCHGIEHNFTRYNFFLTRIF